MTVEAVEQKVEGIQTVPWANEFYPVNMMADTALARLKRKIKADVEAVQLAAIEAQRLIDEEMISRELDNADPVTKLNELRFRITALRKLTLDKIRLGASYDGLLERVGFLCRCTERLGFKVCGLCITANREGHEGGCD